MPVNTSVVFIAVRDRDGRAIPSARVSLRRADSAEWTDLRYDAAAEQWVSDPILLGEYVIRVEAEGYEPQQFPLEAKGSKLYTRSSSGGPARRTTWTAGGGFTTSCSSRGRACVRWSPAPAVPPRSSARSSS